MQATIRYKARVELLAFIHPFIHTTESKGQLAHLRVTVLECITFSRNHL